MKLKNLIENLDYKELVNFKDTEITGISYNSKTTQPGDIFICLVGEHTDGHNYYKNAIEAGTKALMTERKLNTNIPQVIVDSTRQKIADIADKFYNSPSKSFDNFIGVTGTNGKTTVTHLIQKILEHNKKDCALIGTLGYKLSSGDEYKDEKHTTPQAPELQATLNLIKEKQIKNLVMEASSHALEQNRIGGCLFNGAVLTNLTQDHLDYHITMDNYFEAKALLFKRLKKDGFAIINKDDKYADKFISVIPQGVKVLAYGIKNKADIMAKEINFSLKGAEFVCKTNKFGAQPVKLKMNGMFSIYNALAAICTGLSLGFNLENCIKPLEETKGVAGRFEVIVQNPLVIVDYAHTPDGLENVLEAAREITPKTSDLVCLFGCGGDRDATKRPKMGAIAERLSDKIIVTSDNPRSEDVQQIITDILAGLKSINTEKVLVEPDRRKAIELLKTICNKDDVVVIAGKGHETYQIVKDKTIHFDDREEARKVFS